MDNLAPVAEAAATSLPVLFLGDSHVAYLKHAQKNFLLAPRNIDGVEVGGATAVGFRNPNAMTDAIGQYRKFLEGRDRRSPVILHLGEVDCGYVIWFRAEKYGDAVAAQMEHSIGAYSGFADELLDQGWRHVIITGATLPTITDTDQTGEVVARRSGINATQAQRTALTLRYNARLREEAAKRGLAYVDVTQDVLDPATGLTGAKFRNRDPWDHHMRYELAAVAWARRLNPVLDAIAPLPEHWKLWRATTNTFIKAYYAHSKDMPDEMKLAVPAGALLLARYNAHCGEVLAVSDASLNGAALDARLRLIHTAHFSEVKG